MKISAKQILELLAAKHSDDVFVPECKDGPSGTGMARLDAWAMKKSWANPQMIGYEIKVSRADFLRDTKWPAYLSMCHELYWVTPWKMVMPEEIPDGTGLMWVTNTGTRVQVKRKAPHRDIQVPANVMAYILMCRTAVHGERLQQSKAEYWRDWLAKHRDDQVMGSEVRYQIARQIRTTLEQAERRAKNAEQRLKAFEDLERELDSMGIGPGTWNAAERIAERVNGHVPKRIATKAEWLVKSATELAEAISAHNREAVR